MLPSPKAKTKRHDSETIRLKYSLEGILQAREVGLDLVIDKDVSHGQKGFLSEEVAELFGIRDIFHDGIIYREASQKYILPTSNNGIPIFIYAKYLLSNLLSLCSEV